MSPATKRLLKDLWLWVVALVFAIGTLGGWVCLLSSSHDAPELTTEPGLEPQDRRTFERVESAERRLHRIESWISSHQDVETEMVKSDLLQEMRLQELEQGLGIEEPPDAR